MSRNILVVDDEAQIRDLLNIYLKRQGFTVATAATSDETRQKVAQQTFDLIVLDISLAGEDGLNLLAELKAAHPNVKVIMLTGMGFVEDLLQEAHQKGAEGYVSKVLPLDELLLTIQRILRSSEMRAA